MKLQLAIIASFSFLMVGCCHFGHGCYNPSTGLVHSGPCGLFDNCGTGLCHKFCGKKKNCRCQSGCNRGCDPCQLDGTYSGSPMTYGDSGVIYEGSGSAPCPSCQGQQNTYYPELMLPQGTPPNKIVPAPPAEAGDDSQTYTVPYPSTSLTTPPISYSTSPTYLPPQMSSVPPIETSAF